MIPGSSSCERSANDLTGRNLEAELQIFVEKMFEHYPAHWRKMFGPSREATLSEEMQDKSNFKAEETRRENRKMNSSEDESTRPPKHQKANTKAKEVSKPLH